MLGAMVLADAVSTAVRFVTALYYVYLLLIFVYILTSWIRLPYSPWLSRCQRFLHDTVNPYLALFRRLLPALRLGGLGLDLSPILGILALSAAWRLIVAGIEQLR
ncbi:MAG: YggT family protein [Thermoleophilia bacterium]|nr:YggT family protein [Thermoleophilia bacterium]